MNKPEKIIIHHSLTKDGKVVDWTAIRKYHIEHNGWNDIGYHWGIELVGDKWVIQKGRDEITKGSHTKEQNTNYKSIGICVVGNYDISSLPQEAFKLLVKLITDINTRYKKQFPIEPHSKYATYKSCPGKLFPLKAVIDAVYPELTYPQALSICCKHIGYNEKYWSTRKDIDPCFDDLIIKLAKFLTKGVE
jgi:N-acetylmuramoyl-L-alanine amidase